MEKNCSRAKEKYIRCKNHAELDKLLHRAHLPQAPNIRSLCSSFPPFPGAWLGGSLVPVPSLPLLWDNGFYVPLIQLVKTRESVAGTCNKSFPVLDRYILHLQDRTSAVDPFFLVGLFLPPPPQTHTHARCSRTTFFKTQHRCQQANLVSILGVTQCDGPLFPLENPSYAPVSLCTDVITS